MLRRSLESALHAAIAVMNEAAALDGATVVERLLQGVEHEAGMGRARDTPTDDAPGIGIDAIAAHCEA